jgi:hypothetical protein
MWKRIVQKYFLVATSGFLWFTTANLISVACRCDAQKGVKSVQQISTANQYNNKAKKLEEIAAK